MSDIAGIAGNAVAVYQQALTTVSNNIANVSTEGYSRQDVALSALPVTKSGSVFLGSGVSIDRVKRQYDQFVESNLRNTTSDLAAQGPVIDYANRIVDVMGSQSMGLNTALDAFFSSARNLSADPSSTVLRSSFVRDAGAVTDRFGQLSSQLDLVQDQTQQQLDSAVTQINALTSQIAKVNGQLSKQASEATQPPDLLDQRDLLLKKLSEFVHVNTRFEVNGQVNVSVGPTINQDVVVSNQKAVNIGTNYNAGSLEKVALVLDPYGTPQQLSGITSGSLAGLITFREQVLGSTRNALDNLAHSFANEVNNTHQQGIDGYGNPGQDLIKFDTSAPTAAGGIRVAFSDPMLVAAASQFRVIEGPNNPSGTDATLTYADPMAPTAPGALPPPPPPGPAPIQSIFVNNDNVSASKPIAVSSTLPVTAVATIQQGMTDVSIFLDTMQPGQQLQVMTKDGRQLIGSGVSDPSVLANTLTTANGFAAGATSSTAYLNQSGAVGYRGMTVFYGAQASAKVQPVYDPDGTVSLTKTNNFPAVLQGDSIAAMTLGLPAGSFALNGVSLGALPDPAPGTTVKPQDIAAWVNAKSALTGVTASASNTIVVDAARVKFGLPLYINGTAVNTSTAVTLRDLISAINTSNAGVSARANTNGKLEISNGGANKGDEITIAGTTVIGSAAQNALGLTSGIYRGSVSLTQPVTDAAVIPATQLKYDKPLCINGVQISSGSGVPSDPLSLVTAINAQSAQSNVQARLSADQTQLILSNLPGAQGNAITVSRTPLQADVLPGTYIAQTGANALGDSVNNGVLPGPEAANLSPLQLGFGTATPTDLLKLGFRTGAFIKGPVRDDLLVFVTGSGTAMVSASYAGRPADPRQALRASPMTVTFTDDTHYKIVDNATHTVLAERVLDPMQLKPGIQFQGLSLSFTAAPKASDTFALDGNTDGIGNNDNMLAMGALETKAIVGKKTLSNAYVDQINEMGNIARQATISQTALTVVHDQAVKSRDTIAGVSLDQEAADLIRYQQAYQAAAKSLQIAGQLFDAVLHVN